MRDSGAVTVQKARGHSGSQAIEVQPSATVVRLHLGFPCPADVLHLGIAHLETIHDLHSAWVDAGLLRGQAQETHGYAHDEGCVLLPQFPAAGYIGRNDIDVTMHAQPAVILSVPAAADLHGRSHMDRHDRLVGWGRIGDAGRIGPDQGAQYFMFGWLRAKLRRWGWRRLPARRPSCALIRLPPHGAR